MEPTYIDVIPTSVRQAVTLLGPSKYTFEDENHINSSPFVTVVLNWDPHGPQGSMKVVGGPQETLSNLGVHIDILVVHEAIFNSHMIFLLTSSLLCNLHRIEKDREYI